MIENDGDKCYAKESKLVSYNCNISHEIQTEKNKRLFPRLDEPINFENSSNSRPPLCKRWVIYIYIENKINVYIILSFVRIVFHRSPLLVHVVNYGG